MTTSTDTEPKRRRGRPRSGERVEDLRAMAIGQAARLLMAGTVGLSMERVAKEIGVRAPSLYHHFPGGRDEMILSVAEHYGRQFGEALEAIVTEGAGDPLERLREVVRFFGGTGSVHPYNLLTEEQSLLSQAARDSLAEMFAATVEAPLLRLVREGQDAGHFRKVDPDLAMRTLLALLLRLPQMKVAPSAREGLPDFVLDFVLHGLAEK